MITWRFYPMGEAALLIEALPADDLINREVLALARALDAAPVPGVFPSTPAINSLLIPFDPLQTSHAALERLVRDLINRVEPLPAAPERVVSIPVRYGGEDGPDLTDVARQLALTPGEVVAAHSGATYRVMTIGFAPGFPYLGPLPTMLHLPRRATPRTRVPAGSVAIAADMTGIYPAVLPGGWHLIGRTPLRLFDPYGSPPSLLAPGDGVQFDPLPDEIVP